MCVQQSRGGLSRACGAVVQQQLEATGGCQSSPSQLQLQQLQQVQALQQQQQQLQQQILTLQQMQQQALQPAGGATLQQMQQQPCSIRAAGAETMQ